MNMGELYTEMKRAIEFFGLNFHQMDRIEVIINGDFIIFKYGSHKISYNVKKDLKL